MQLGQRGGAEKSEVYQQTVPKRVAQNINSRARAHTHILSNFSQKLMCEQFQNFWLLFTCDVNLKTYLLEKKTAYKTSILDYAYFL
jgi:hypothetical protein